MENVIEKYEDIIEKHKEKLHENIFISKDILANEIADGFDKLYEKIISNQETGNKEKIQAINISLLRTGFKTRGINCIVEAFNENWLFDEKPITYTFELGTIFDEFHILEEYLKMDTKKYVKKYLNDKIEKLILEQLGITTYYFIELARYALGDIVKNNKFKEINKEEKFYIAAGEYRDKGLIIYSDSNTYEDLKSSLTYIDQMKTLRGRCFKNLYFKDKEYIFHDLIGNVFDESIFENIKLEKCALAQTSFKNCSLNSVSFEGSILHDAFFYNSNIKKVRFQKVYSTNIYDRSKTILTGVLGTQFLNSKIEDSSFKKSILNGSDFRHSSIEKVDFTECGLKQADFRECILNYVEFTNADLKDAKFNKNQLSSINLSDEQLNSIKLG